MSQGDDMQGKKHPRTLAESSETQPTGRRAERLLEDELAGEARRERVTFLRREIAAGRYAVDDERLAAALCDYIIGLNEARRRA
jgi:anti-sigma28 factor (negative regulator of flagellin synthesis)